MAEQPQDEDKGAPEWMVTFSDCMTLLLTFFVLMLTFSSFDDRVFRKLQIIYSNAFDSVHFRMKSSKEAFMDFTRHVYDETEQGSEKPTLEKGQEGAIQELNIDTYKKNNAFIIASRDIFWGNGSAISTDGQKILSALGDFLRTMQGQVIISEQSPKNSIIGTNQDSRDLSLVRNWQVLQFFVTQKGLPRERFNISAGTTVGSIAFDALRLDKTANSNERVLEIVLLDRSIYN